MASFTEFCCRSGGSNLNAGSRSGSSTEPGTSADFTYASGSWVASTGVFTVASGNPSSDGVAVGDWASVYPDGSTTAVFIGRVTARTTTTITVSLTVKGGTAPTDGTSNRTVKIGGAWAGPSGGTAFPFGIVNTAMQNLSSNPVRVNMKNDQTYSLTAGISVTSGVPAYIAGYTTSYGDLGRTIFDGGTSGASYSLWTLGATAGSMRLEAFEFRNNGATGSTAGVTISNTSSSFVQCVFHDFQGSGLNGSSAVTLVECEFYLCNKSNTANLGGISVTGAVCMRRTIFHDNTGTNNQGAYVNGSSSAQISHCIFDSNGTSAGLRLGASANAIVENSDFYNNVGPGILIGGGFNYVDNCNFFKNGTYGISGSSGHVQVYNSTYGSGTQANGSGTISMASYDEGSPTTYASGGLPWIDAPNGDFRNSASTAGRGSFLQTQSGYAGTTFNDTVGAATVATTSNNYYFPVTRRKVV